MKPERGSQPSLTRGYRSHATTTSPPDWSLADDELIRRLRKTVHPPSSYTEIAKQLNRSAAAVRQRYQKISIGQSTSSIQRRRWWSDEDSAIVVKMAESGASHGEIGVVLGRATVAVGGRRRSISSFAGQRKSWTQQDDARLVEVRAKRTPWDEIAVTLERPPSTVHAHYYSIPLPREKRHKRARTILESDGRTLCM